MGNVDHGHSLRSKTVHKQKQPLYLRTRKRRRGFVENNNPCIRIECLGDLDELAFSRTEICHHGVGRKLETHRAQTFFRLLSHGPPIDNPETRNLVCRETRYEQVLSDRKVGKQIKFLM